LPSKNNSHACWYVIFLAYPDRRLATTSGGSNACAHLLTFVSLNQNISENCLFVNSMSISHFCFENLPIFFWDPL